MNVDTCFVCGAKLELCWEGDPSQHDGTHFWANGNYGSGVFDPMDSHLSLHISICDTCMTTWKSRVTLVKRTQPPATYEQTPWQPEEKDRG